MIPYWLKPDGEDGSDLWMGEPRPRNQPLHWEWLFDELGTDDGYMRFPCLHGGKAPKSTRRGGSM